MVKKISLASVAITAAVAPASASSASETYNSIYSMNPNGRFRRVKSGGFDALVPEMGDSARRWLMFPSQKQLHDWALELPTESESLRSQLRVNGDASFWSNHRTQLGLPARAEMRLARESRQSSMGVKYLRFDQFVDGFRVWGGDFQLTVGRHGGVLNAQGLPVPSGADASDYNIARVRSFDLKVLKETVITHLRDILEVSASGITVHRGVEIVWHNSLTTVAKSGRVRLAYYLDGSAHDESGQPMQFDAFLDVRDGSVIQFIDKSLRMETSPFQSPLPNATINVYDQWRKDLNDDFINDDDYYHPDPDRYSNLTLVFQAPSDVYTYPTTDSEMNDLIDTTLYVKYLFYSLSNGEYLTWAKEDRVLNIEYNLTLSNAYFDGYWGIHFGTGYITDDVVCHEWTHGYTQTGNGLIYAEQSGAMNEAFSDIFGEAIDILNQDTLDTDTLRTEWPTTCTKTFNSPYGVPPGNDEGHRWAMGEDVITSYENGDGSIRDMYRPDCYFQPSTTLSDYYTCSTYYDNGGVHKNSGILNRLFAVLSDGGQYEDPSAPGTQLRVTGLGLVKSTNLFWRAHEALTPTSQYIDLAIALQDACELSIGRPLYLPNLYNFTITESSEQITDVDCQNVAVALKGSGMDKVGDFCPNIVCEDLYECSWKNCPASTTEIFHEDYDVNMGFKLKGKMDAVCSASQEESTYARVFDQASFNLKGMEISCIQFGYFMMGKTNVTLDVYIDSNGGEPDYASMRHLHSMSTYTINAAGNMQVQTMSAEAPVKLSFSNSDETLVIVLRMPYMSQGFITGGGQLNPNGTTYVGGACKTGFQNYSDYKTNSTEQWYVRVYGSSSSDSTQEDDNNDKSSLSGGAIAGIVIAAVAVVAVAGFVVFRRVKPSDESATKPLL